MTNFEGTEIEILMINGDKVQGILRSRIEHKNFCASSPEFTHYIASGKRKNLYKALIVVCETGENQFVECTGEIK